MKITSITKFLDQPLLSSKLGEKMPLLMSSTALLFATKDIFEKPKDERKKSAIKNIIIMACICSSTILGCKFIRINGEKLINNLSSNEILKKQNAQISKFILENKIESERVKQILNKAKTKFLNPNETDFLLSNINHKKDSSTELINSLFGTKDSVSSKEIFNEISKLSILGFIPVISGIFGGILSDKITNEYTNEKTVNKFKEGFYQFFANIFLCNLGAATFLYTAEKMNQAGIIKSLSAPKKTLAILCGILAVGVVGGSYIANFVSNKIVHPIINKYKKTNYEYQYRKPEAIDIALHTDDIATAGILSGVKWIEPLLPIMYLISGYRAATGYTNKNKKD